MSGNYKHDGLRVKPVRRYRQPKYPSHDDPDPTQHPYPVPYPISRKLLFAAASVGLATSCSRAPDLASDSAGAQTAEAEMADLIQLIEDTPEWPTDEAADLDASPVTHESMTAMFEALQSLGDPPTVTIPAGQPSFTLALSGLPHRTSGYGTGVPNYIDAEIAREAIAAVFQRAGYKLQKKHAVEADDVAFIADGYDTERKVGYVYGTWDNLDGDALVHWWVPASDPTKGLDARVEMLSAVKGADAEIKAAKAISDAGRREAALRAIVDRYSKKLLSLEEAKRLDQLAAEGDRFVAVISQFDRRFSYHGWVSGEDEEKITAIPDAGKRQIARREAERKIAAKAIANLEQSVREYIDWARRQGGAVNDSAPMSSNMVLENSAGCSSAQLKRRWFAAALCLLAAAAPVGIAWLVGELLHAESRPAVLSVGILAGLAVGQLAGLRRGSLAGLLLGPAVGFGAGFLDLKIFIWLYSYADWPLNVTALLPVWGGLLGIWVCLYRKSWSARVAIIFAIAFADFAARLIWSWAARSDLATPLMESDYRIFIEGLVYSPAAILIVAFTQRATKNRAGSDEVRAG